MLGVSVWELKSVLKRKWNFCMEKRMLVEREVLIDFWYYGVVV